MQCLGGSFVAESWCYLWPCSRQCADDLHILPTSLTSSKSLTIFRKTEIFDYCSLEAELFLGLNVSGSRLNHPPIILRFTIVGRNGVQFHVASYIFQLQFLLDLDRAFRPVESFPSAPKPVNHASEYAAGEGDWGVV